MRAFAHSVPELDIEKWEPLSAHLSAVGDHAAELAAAFGWGEVARIAGRLHDIGKVSAEFQAYIRGQRPRGGDHSTAGARVAVERYGHPLGRMLALAVAGHHAGLADAGSLEARLRVDHPIPPYPTWETVAGDLPPVPALNPARQWKRGDDKGFAQALLVRMLFSCGFVTSSN